MQSQKRPAVGGGGAPPASKRRANPDDEDELDAMILDEEEMLMADEEGPPEPFDEIEGVMEGTGAVESLAKQWRRPELPPIDPSNQSVDFQQIEADYEVRAQCGARAGRRTPSPSHYRQCVRQWTDGARWCLIDTSFLRRSRQCCPNSQLQASKRSVPQPCASMASQRLVIQSWCTCTALCRTSTCVRGQASSPRKLNRLGSVSTGGYEVHLRTRCVCCSAERGPVRNFFRSTFGRYSYTDASSRTCL
eukprot:scaffold34447_cov36-Tisochrysis_lutea.AAC.1